MGAFQPSTICPVGLASSRLPPRIWEPLARHERLREALTSIVDTKILRQLRVVCGVKTTPGGSRFLLVQQADNARDLRGACELLRIGTVMFVAEWEARTEAGGFQDIGNLLKSCTPYDMASGIAYNLGGPACFVQAGHLRISASMISMSFVFVSSSSSAW
jgi:hypothetical protein